MPGLNAMNDPQKNWLISQFFWGSVQTFLINLSCMAAIRSANISRK